MSKEIKRQELEARLDRLAEFCDEQEDCGECHIVHECDKVSRILGNVLTLRWLVATKRRKIIDTILEGEK